MGKQTKNDKQTGVSITIVNSEFPILKHPTWMDISYLDQSTEKELLSALEQNLPMAEDLAKSTGTDQIKIATEPEWEELSALGFSPAVYHMQNTIPTLSNIDAEMYHISQETEPSTFKDLISDYFTYQGSFDPKYYTTDTETGTADFIKQSAADISSGKTFFLVASKDDVPVGFLYGGFSSQYGILQEIFVIEKERKKGIGTALLKASAERYDDGGCREVVGYVGVNAPALEFYDAREFKKTAKNWIKNLT